MVFHDNASSSSVLVENGAEAKLGRSKCYSIHRENTQNAELDWQNLVCASNLDRNSHCEFFKLVFGRVFILLHKVLLAGLKNRAIRPKLKPDLKLAVALNITKRGVKLKIRLKVFGEE